ncbi:hypothetical protein FSO04_25020 [Paraburkholderia madseniana]|uniref:Uncharacterized protein n=1 Tax=Paraburkholderia madseniana TaxID=2599607 RepID=A0A6N6WBC9_9BURK|nr:hypothetical protein [Paraburkholderia madseniana]KAE8757208.1 hypothetical protein FSO04_25020 [Paraburkholderia madseniana]
MTSNRALKPVIFPETAAEGYFVHARYGDEQLMSPEAGTFYVELETAIALGLAWVNDCHTIDPKTLRVSSVCRRNRDIIAMVFRFRDVRRCGVLIARSGFEPPRREKPLQLHQRWWEKLMR